MPTFRHRWFEEHSQAQFEKHLKPLAGQPLMGFEVGVFEGLSTTWLLNNVLTHPESKLKCVDTFDVDRLRISAGVEGSDVEKVFRDNVYETGRSASVEVMKDYSLNVLRKLGTLRDGQFDFIFVDGSHKADVAFQDLALSAPLLKVGGLLLIDDYLVGDWDHKPCDDPENWQYQRNPLNNRRMVANVFMQAFVDSFTVIELGYVAVLRKYA